MQIGGLSSGIDTVGLVDQLIQLERKPIILMNSRKSTIQKQMDAWRDVNTRLNNLKNKLQDLKGITAFQTQKTNSSNEAIATLSSKGGSVTGSFELEVKSLATSTRITSGSALSGSINPNEKLNAAGFGVNPTSGRFTINGTVIEINSAEESLSDIIGKINTQVTGVNASYNPETDQLTLTSTNGDLRLGSGADTSNFLQATKVLSQTGDGVTSITSSSKLGGTKVAAKVENAGLAASFTENSGSFLINGVEISYDISKDSLRDIINRVNESKAKVTMAYDSVNDKLVIQAKDTGRMDILLEDKSGNFLEALKVTEGTSEKKLGQNASFVLNGTEMTSTSNSVSGVVDGLTFELKKAAPGEKVTLNVNQDVDTTFDKIKAFVDQYNSVMSFTNTKLGKGAELQGDSSLISVQSNLRRNLTGPIDGLNSEFKMLSAIGIEVEKTGTLKINESKLKDAIKEQGNSVFNLFNSEEPEGIIKRLEVQLDSLTKSGTGIISNKQKTYENRIKDINKQVERMDQRLEMRRETMLRQFRAMEQTMSRFMSQGAWLDSQLGQMVGWSNNTKK